ncbi:spondin-1-like isoform X2 [Zophobas morio]|uniref:spondin-1-like isoform X2 n=1 Tax=Zophobas morio TaxID=2755281 RepID=UPI003082C7BF
MFINCTRDTMKRNSFIILILLVLAHISLGYVCDRTPKKGEKIPKTNNGRYVIEVVGNPSTYSPGQIYTIVLKSHPQNPITNYFTEFMLVVEPQSPSEALQDILTGELKPVDHSIVKFTPKCPSAVIQTNTLAKSGVEVLWTAPPSGNGCIYIKATVFESGDSWFADDGGLTKLLCEEEENRDVQPDVLEQCCTCNEAKYEVAFRGLWTRNTHPTDYPINMWATKLGEVIGASHKISSSFWNYSTTASDGLKLLAEDGETSLLEDELKERVKNDDIRTIIKARELPFPNITGTSYTVFRVDQEHHLISLVSKITPSPDWIVGVANLELCTAECDWIESRTLNLYPWDIGTDDGVSYESADSPTSPPDAVKLITSDLEKYPFYNSNGDPIKPIAELRITRQKLYEKVCSNMTSEPEPEDDPCQLSEWTEYSTCSGTCGNSVKTRDRQLLKPENEEECTKEGPLLLQDTINCEEESECELTRCANVTWSEWTPCNITCGRGFKSRSEVSSEENNNEQTEETSPCEETVECEMPACEEDTASTGRSTLLTDSQVISEGPSYNPVVDCEVSLWSDWGPCSATEPCTRGYQYKERHIITHPLNGGTACPKRLRKEKRCKVSCSKKHKVSTSTSSEVDCQLSEWSGWSPCSSNCGTSAVQIRTRTVVVPPSNGGKECGPRLEQRKCSLPFGCHDREWLFINKN